MLRSVSEDRAAYDESSLLLNTEAVNNQQSQRKRAKLALYCIYATELLERIAFYSLIGNLIYLLNQNRLSWTSMNAASQTLLANGVSYISALLAGFLATYAFGKYVTIVIGFILYVIGYSYYPFVASEAGGMNTLPFVSFVYNFFSPLCHLAPVNTSAPTITYHRYSYWQDQQLLAFGSPAKDDLQECSMRKPVSNETCFAFVTATMALIGVAVGSLKANLVPLGVELCEQNPEYIRSFVNRYYWFTNAGAAIAYLTMLYIQQVVCMFYGLFPPFCLLLVAALIFISSRLCMGMTLSRNDTGVPASNTRNASILFYLIQRRACCYSHQRSAFAYDLLTRQLPPELQYNKKSCWNAAKQSYGGKFFDDQVEDLRATFHIAAVLSTLVPFWLVYSQMQTTFVIQGWHMQFFLFNYSCNMLTASSDCAYHYQVPAAALSIVNIVVVVLLIPATNWLYRSCETRLGRRVRYVERIVVGHVFACASMSVAGYVEMKRLQAFWGGSSENSDSPMNIESIIVQYVGRTPYFAPQMSIFWQVPQYALIGVAEVLTSISTLEYACARAPPRLTAIVMGIYWVVVGTADFCGIYVLQAVHGWLLFDGCHDGLSINCRIPCQSAGVCACRLDYYFFLLAVVVAAGLVLFCLCVYWLGMDSHHVNVTSLTANYTRRSHGGGLSNHGTHASGSDASIDVVYNRQSSNNQRYSVTSPRILQNR